MKTVIAFKRSDVVFIILINIKKAKKLTFMSKINFMLSLVEHDKSFTISGPGLTAINVVWVCSWNYMYLLISGLCN